jgi:hypothetical protein
MARIEMAASFRERLNRWSARAFLILLAVGGVAPSTAWAGCDHVSSNLSLGAQGSLHDLELFRYSAVRPGEPTPTVPRRDSRCSGPFCSQGPGLPQAPVPSLTLKSEFGCVVKVAHRTDDLSSVEAPTDHFPSRPRYSTFPPQRPPRHS